LTLIVTALTSPSLFARSAMSGTQSSSLPPSYSDPFAENISERSSQSTGLPAYSVGRRVRPTPPTPQAVPKEFDYELKYKGKPLATMTIIAAEAFSKHVPTFLERQPIKGRVKLSFDKPYRVQAVVISAYGQIVTGQSAVEKFTFVEVSSTLWSTTMGNRRLESVGNSATGSDPGMITGEFTSKLEGEYIWDFSLNLPKEIIVPSGLHNEPQVFNLPQTFYERHTRVRIVYEVALRIVRRKLRADPRVAASFGYIPIQRPGPFSTLRRLAYEEGMPLLGPTIDPTGWHASRQIRIQGKVFNDRSIDMGCTLFLAEPLCYTRGSVIPLILLLESQDHEALDLLSSPRSVVVRLRRFIQYHSGEDPSFERSAWRDPNLEHVAWRNVVDYSPLARWWPSAEISADFHSKRYLNGELHLVSDVKPTSAIIHFRMEYAVVLFPFDIIGYESTSNEPLFEKPVEIVTAFGNGPRPMSFAPPEYE